MESDRVLTRLFDAGVLIEDETGAVTASPEFEARIDRWRDDLVNCPPADRERVVEDALPRDESPDRILGVAQADTDRIAEYLSLTASVPDLSVAERLHILPILDQIMPDPPRTDGAPSAFLSIHGDRLASVIRSVDAAVVYIWRDDCPPCETVREDLETVFPEPPGDIALYAVFGPDSARILQEEFQVTGGPVILFVRDGRIDSRLVGAQYPEAVEAEVEKIRAQNTVH